MFDPEMVPATRDTRDTRDTDAYRDWKDALSAHSHGLEVQSLSPDLTGEIKKFDFAGATLWYVASSQQVMRRVHRSTGGTFRPMAIIHLSGKMRISQEGRSCALNDPSFTYIDSSVPHELEYDGDFSQLVLQFPRTTFRSSVYRRALGMAMQADNPVNAPFFSCVQRIWASAPNLDPLQYSSALSALTSLSYLTTAMSKAESQRDVPVRVTRAMEFIEQHLADFELCPERVANAQGVSRRYLDALFMQHGHRLQSWIWERRLVRAADDLLLNQESNHTILQSALDHGFKTPSHFSRTFAKRFGMPPREYRRQHGISRLN